MPHLALLQAEYEALAVDLGVNHARRNNLRARLKSVRTTCPLFATAQWVLLGCTLQCRLPNPLQPSMRALPVPFSLWPKCQVSRFWLPVALIQQPRR